MSGTRVPSAPGPGYDPKWMYWFWDWVRANRPGYVGTGASFAGDVSGTLNAGTSTLSLSTTGVTAGTYGLSTSVGQFTVDAKGRLTQAANVGISFPAVAGTSYLTGDVLGTAPLHGTGTTVLSSVVVAGTFGDATVIPRFSIDSKGRVLSGTNAGTLGTFGGFNSLVGAGDLLGTTTTNTFTGALSTTGVAAGTYGAATIWPRVVVDAKGRLTNATNVGTLGTFGGFNSLVGVGDLLGTTTTNTFTGALSTTGVVAGTYGAPAGVPRFDVDAKGRILSGTTVGTLTSLHLGTGALGTTTPLEVFGVTRFHRLDNTSAGGLIRFGRSVDGATGWQFSVSGTGTQANLNITNIPGTTGTAQTTPFLIVGSSDEVRFTGTATAQYFRGGYLHVGAGDVLGTSTTGTFTAALGTTGVVAGTYGAPAGVPRFDIDAKGRVLSGTTVGTLASLVLGTGDPSSATVLTVLGLGRFRRNDTSGEGGEIVFDRSLDGSVGWRLDVNGTSTQPGFRVINNAGTTGTSATVPFSIVGVTDEVRMTGTATAAFFQGGYRHVGVGDVLGTSLTGTFTAALSTTGVISGTYSQVTVDAKGRVTAGGTASTGVGYPDNLISTSGTIGSNKSYIVGHRLEISSGINWELGTDAIGMIL